MPWSMGFYTNFQGRSWQIPQGDDFQASPGLPAPFKLGLRGKKTRISDPSSSTALHHVASNSGTFQPRSLNKPRPHFCGRRCTFLERASSSSLQRSRECSCPLVLGKSCGTPFLGNVYETSICMYITYIYICIHLYVHVCVCVYLFHLCVYI